MIPDVFFTDLMEGGDADGDGFDSDSSGIGGDVSFNDQLGIA